MRKLIIAFDIGTTFSGVSYCINEPGFPPIIQGVNRVFLAKHSFPGQLVPGSNSKIPSHLLYLEKEAFRVGDEVDEFERDKSKEAANTRSICTKTAWFKLELRPGSLPLSDDAAIRSQLPDGVSPVEVYADFLRYLYDCTKRFIKESEIGGESLFQDESRLRFIITHPNGWEHAQQIRLRSAAKTAGLISRLDDSRLSLLTEGEAAIHHCIREGLSREALQSDDGIMVIDAGGGTIDLSAYKRSSGSEDRVPKFEEIVRSQCLMAGSVFVTKRAEEFLNRKLKGSAFERDVGYMAQKFDQVSKRLFKSNSGNSYIQFGRPGGDEDAESLGIRDGNIALTFNEVASFFQPSLDTIIQTIDDMKTRALTPIKYVFLVGGFAASPWLYARLRDALQPAGIILTRPDKHVNKAVADGAVAYYLNHYVTVRVARLTYGTRCYVPFDPQNPKHLERINSVFQDPIDGQQYIDGFFCPILLKGTQVRENQVFSSNFFRKFQDLKGPDFENPLRDRIFCYRGEKELKCNELICMDGELGNYHEIFVLRSTLDRDMLRALDKNALGRTRSRKHTHLDYDIRFSFGLTELKVQAAMKFKKPGLTQGFETEFEKSFEPKLIPEGLDCDEPEEDSDV